MRVDACPLERRYLPESALALSLAGTCFRWFTDSFDCLSVVAAPEPRPSNKALELIQGSLSAGKIARRSPLLGGLHRLMDGTLLGVVGAVAVLAGLTLHWQHRWTLAFNRLESTRTQAHRLTESTALLEQHLLRSTTQPAALVPTQVANLIHLDRPETSAQFRGQEPSPASSKPATQLRIHHGY